MAWWPDNLTDWIVIISGVATAVLVIIIGIQLSITKREIESRQRPWIYPIDVGRDFITFDDGSARTYDEGMTLIIDGKLNAKPLTQKVSIKIKNFGTTPTEITYSALGRLKKFNREEIESKGGSFTYWMMPNEEKQHQFVVDHNKQTQGIPFYIGISIKYSINGKQEVKTGRIWELIYGSRNHLEEWMEQ